MSSCQDHDLLKNQMVEVSVVQYTHTHADTMHLNGLGGFIT